jgi:pimeloyl-ACP methyl ester carboxylesterase
MKETICQFGPDESLFGIVTEPTADKTKPDAPAVIFLNSGVLHHVGPFGWMTTLARRLADRGATTFRFDLSGIGESPARNDGRDNLDVAIDDALEAMNFLEQTRSIRRFVLFGLCSGAVLAHYVSSRDSRVVGTVNIDTFSYPTKGFYLRQVGEKALRWQSWMTATKMLARKIGSRAVASGDDDSNEQSNRLLVNTYFLPKPSQEQARENLAATLKRGTRMLYIYTDTVRKYFNHPRQFQEMYGDLPRSNELIEIDFTPSADHLYSTRRERLAMFNRVELWVDAFVRQKEKLVFAESVHQVSL